MSSGMCISVFTTFFLSLAVQAQSIPQSITVEGRLYDAGNPMGAGQANELVNFKLEVLVEGTSCVLYSEEHANIDVAGSNTAAGFFALPLGSGTSVVNPLGSFAKVFSNSENVSAIASCTTVTLTNQRRLVRIHVNQASAGATYATLSPDTVLTSVPTAMIAETSQSTNSFGGKTAAGFVQTNTTGSNVLSQANVESIFETNNFGRLQNLLNATAVSLGNRPITGVSDPTNASDAATKNYADTKLTGLPVALVDVGVGTGTGKVLTWNGSAWTATTPTLSGAAGGDLTGTYPNPTVANLAIGTSKLADGSVTSAKINTTGIAKNRILITDSTTGATVSYATCSANEVLKFTSAALGWECTPVASIAPVVSVNGQTGAVVLTGANLGLGSASMRNIGIGTSNVPEILATGKLDPAIIPSLSGDLTGAAPNLFVARLQGRQIAATPPGTGHILQWNGSQWEPAAPAVSGITALNGDVTAAGPGLTAATITNGAITTPKVFNTPGANRLVATDNISGATLVPFVCTIDETMKWTASGWACATVNSMLGSQVIIDGGNTRGAAIVVGTKDNFDFNIKTNETTHVSIAASGNVGIGTTNPTRKLEVNGLLRLSPSALPAGAAGDITLDAAAGNALKYHNGTAWQTLGTGTGDFLAAGTLPMTGAFRSVAGTAGSPGMSFVGDTDNGFYAPAADNLAIVNGGVETIRFANGGNIGVGVTNPTSLLDLRKDQGSQTGIVLTNKSGSSSAHAAYVLQNDGGGRAYFDVGSSSATGNYMNRMSIGADGTMNGVNLVSEYLGGDFRFFIGGISTANEKMRLQSNGALGLGVTGPLRLLHVAGPIRIAPSTMPSSPSAGDIAVDSTASNSLKFHNGTSWQSLGTGDFLANGTVAMTGNIRLNNNWLSNDGGGEGIRVDNSGNVGIGVTNPSYLLEIGGTAKASLLLAGQMTINYGNNYSYVGSSASSGILGGGSGLYVSNSNGSDLTTAPIRFALMNSSGNSQQAYISGVSTSGSSSYSPSIVFGRQTGTSAYTESMRINENGNVGIGVTDPAAKLEVRGQFRTGAPSGGTYSNSGNAVDWNNGNIQTTSYDCAGGNISFSNMLDGAVYTLAVTSTTVNMCTFTQGGLTFFFAPGNGLRNLGQRTVYTFQRIGNDVYVSWVAGFQ